MKYSQLTAMFLTAVVIFAAVSNVVADQIEYATVRVHPHRVDKHTTFLATFDKSIMRADFAAGSPTLIAAGVKQVAGAHGKAAFFDKQRLEIEPSKNISAKAGTIELILKDTNHALRHRFASATGKVSFTAQLEGGLWWAIGGGDNIWVRDVNMQKSFDHEWVYVILGWDAQKGIKTVRVVDLNGRHKDNSTRYHDTGKMGAKESGHLLKQTFSALSFGSPGLVIDTIRISNVYRADLLDPVRDWGPVEQFRSYNGENLFDNNSLIKRWAVGKPDGISVSADRVATFNPVIRDDKYRPTDKTKPAVPVARFSPGNPKVNFDLGTLDIGCYVVRVIAAAPTEHIEQVRKPMYVQMTVDDKPGGSKSIYRHRIPYWDEFYCVTELYVNVDEKRNYLATIELTDKSTADLYVHAIELHDVLAGLPRVAAKKIPSRFTLAERDHLRANSDPKVVWEKVRKEASLDRVHRAGEEPITSEARRKRDEILWNAFPPINSQFVADYDESFVRQYNHPGEMPSKKLVEEHGQWRLNASRGALPYRELLFRNDKLGLTYTRDDLANFRPLPDPYPIKDDGLGVYFPQTGDMKHAMQFLPLATMLGTQWMYCWSTMAGWHGGVSEYRLPYIYHALGQENAARDAALILARWAYTYPTHTDAQTLGYTVISPASMYQRDMRLMRRGLMFYRGSSRGANLQNNLAIAYDYLFDYIKGNQELAGAVGRFIPWVKTEEDVRRLIETRILQFGAKQSLKFQLINSKNHSAYLLTTAMVQQDPEVTRPWLEALWEKTHIYPHPRAGLADFVSTTTQRDGTTDIGSVFYTWGGSPFLETVAMTRRYVANGGDSKFDLSDFKLYGKMPVGCAFPLDSAVAGGYPMTIGDVGSPDKPRMLTRLVNFEKEIRYGYEWTGDPRFAWLIKHYFGRRAESDEQWAAIEAAAQKQGRNPFLSQSSRLMANWAGILEAGQAFDDYRKKRALYMRVGFGHGHAHGDALDLQLITHGVRMLNDLGHRGSYNTTSAVWTRMHNRIEVNGADHPRKGQWSGYSWVDTFKPVDGVQYLSGVAVPPYGHRNVSHYSRAAALIDVHTPSVSEDRPYDGLYMGEQTRHNPVSDMSQSYVFDVQRIAGGDTPTCNFHGNYSEAFDVNLVDRVPVGQSSHDKSPQDTSPDADYLKKFLDGPGLKYAGNVQPDGYVQATWKLRRSEGVIEGILPHKPQLRKCNQKSAEKIMLGEDFDPQSPAKYTRLHLFDRQGDRIMVGYPSPSGPKHAEQTWPYLMVQNRTGKDDQSVVYPAIIEAYAGEPFISKAVPVNVTPNSDGVHRAVALRVTTTNGRTDLCYSDGIGDQWRQTGDAKVAARFAYISRDKDGIRCINVVEGSGVKLPGLEVIVDTPAYTAGITAVDYLARRVTLDQQLPADMIVGEVFEVGNEHRKTSFTITAAENVNGVTVVTFDKPADLAYSRVTEVDSRNREVRTQIAPVGMGMPGLQAGLTCTNEDMSKSWKCETDGSRGKRGCVYKLSSNVSSGDMPVGSVMRLWEFGVDDEVRIPTHVKLLRDETQPDGFAVTANVGVKLSTK